jgi:predicted permease
MTFAVFYKLLAIFAAVGIGWVAARAHWLGRDTPAAARVLSSAAFFIFVPCLLFRTMVRQDFTAMPWHTVAAYFVPALVFTLACYLALRGSAARHGAAAPATRATAAVYGNTVQMGVPMAAAMFGEGGLAIHITLVSLHGLLLLTVLTVLVEVDLARRDPAATHASTLLNTVRSAVVHPVVLPVLAGLVWNLGGLGLPPVLDEALATLGSAVVPVCLVLIGVSLAAYGVRGSLGPALGLSVLKLVVMPALVLVTAHWGFGLSGMPLAVLVMMAATPVGSNALIFAQRYRTLEAEATAAIVFSTLGFCVTAALWLAVLARL